MAAKKKVEAVPAKINLASIDLLGDVKKELKKLKKQEKVLVDQIKPLMADHEVIETTKYKAELDVSQLKQLDWPGVIKKLGQKKFNELARVTLEELGKHLGADEIDALTLELKPQRSLSVDPLE